MPTTWSTVGTGPVQGSWPGSLQSAWALAGTVSEAARIIAAAMVFIRALSFCSLSTIYAELDGWYDMGEGAVGVIPECI
jgi:hypothetical protein